MLSRYLTAIVVVKADDFVTEDTILAALDAKAKDNNLPGFMKIKAIHITRDAFTTDNGLITPSLKICGYKIAKEYESVLTELQNRIN